ncbi:hypothetical protein U1Q18_015282 [Sarracenia purpurea var. burkii]
MEPPINAFTGPRPRPSSAPRSTESPEFTCVAPPKLRPCHRRSRTKSTLASKPLLSVLSLTSPKMAMRKTPASTYFLLLLHESPTTPVKTTSDRQPKPLH